MAEWCGWVGGVLDVDLSRGTIKELPLDRRFAETYLGGRGINMRLLYDNVKPGIDPLGPENVLFIGTGPLTGTAVGGRCQVTTKSPMTGLLGDSNAGGFFGASLKYAGFDHVIVRGQSAKPVYLWIDDGRVEIRDAGELWGLDTWRVTDLIRQRERDENIQVMGIGQAGENQVRFACVINSIARANGRTGTGAVMGSKRLKAIAVRGRRGIKIADPRTFKDLVWQFMNGARKSPTFEWYPKYGTPILTEVKEKMGTVPVKNWTGSELPGTENITGKAFYEHYAVKHRACHGCWAHCDHYYTVKDGPWKGTAGPGLEYESVNAFGSRCGNTDFGSILAANNLANQYGLDVVSAGGAIALAMDLYEHGIITEADTDGVPLRWADGQLIVDLLHKMARREGFGDILAEGPYWMAQRIGRGAPARVMHNKKLDPTAVEIRGYKGYALSYTTSTRGADHLRGLLKTEAMGHAHIRAEAQKKFGSAGVTDPGAYDPEGKPRGVQWYQHLSLIADMAEICKFNTFWVGFPIYIEDIGKMLTAVTGVEFTEQRLVEVAERVFNIEKAYNIREGFTREDDMPCERQMTEPLGSGPLKGEYLDREKFARMLEGYYRITGGDPTTGFPLPETLHRLGLPDVAADLAALGKIPKGR